MNNSHLCVQNDDCSDKQATMGLTTFPSGSRDKILSEEFGQMYELIVDQVIGTFLSYLSVFDNIIAMIVFTKMGFQETVNISLSAIAFWDIVKGVGQIFFKLHVPLRLVSEPFSLTWNAHASTIFGLLSGIAGYVSGVMAAYVSIERCLCVSLPFTVKFLLTRKVVIVVNVLISFIVSSTYALTYMSYSIYWVYSPKYNQTIAKNGHSAYHEKYPQIDRFIKVMSLAYPFSCFIIICICSAVTLYFLRKSSKFRSSSAAAVADNKSQAAQQQSNRERQITKILLTIIAVYIATYIPRLCFYIIFNIMPDFRPNGFQRNFFWTIVNTMFAFDLLNSAVNPIILYFMSSQFRNTLNGMFCRSRQKK